MLVSHTLRNGQLKNSGIVSEASNLVQIVLGDYLMPIDIQVNESEFKAHNLPISVSKTITRNFCIVTTCKVMPMYKITISKSFAN